MTTDIGYGILERSWLLPGESLAMRHLVRLAFASKEIYALIRKLMSLVLCGAMAVTLCSCGTQDTDTGTSLALQDDSTYVLKPEENAETTLDGSGAIIALAVDSDGTDTGMNAMLWQGVQQFCTSFNYTAQLFAADGEGTEANEDALRKAAESGAELIICTGQDMEIPLYELQNNYPTISYLLMDGEPHSEDYASYSTASNTHCVLFSEEQAGYLAGYAAVSDGYTSLGFLGADMLPGIVRYGTGFLQGAQAAAEQNGVEVYLKIWYSGQYDASEEIAARMSGWYSDGTQLIFACGGTLAQSCVDAAQESGGHVIAADWNQSGLGSQVVGSAVKRYSTVVQNQLYSFYADGAGWNSDQAGQTERVGVSSGALGLTTAQWNFIDFSQEEYEQIYAGLVSGSIKVERYSDPDPSNLPQTANVACDYQN